MATKQPKALPASRPRKPAARRTEPDPDRSAPPTPGQVRAAWKKYHKLLWDCRFQSDIYKGEVERVRLLAETTTPADPLAVLLSTVKAFVDRFYPEADHASVHLSFPDDRIRSLSMPVFLPLKPEGGKPDPAAA